MNSYKKRIIEESSYNIRRDKNARNDVGRGIWIN